MDKDFHKALATWQEALENLAEAKRLSTEAVRLSAKAKSLGDSSLTMAYKVWTERIQLED